MSDSLIYFQGLSPKPNLGLVSLGITTKLIWVDGTNGDNATAAIYRQDRPFKTLTAAKTAASSGDTIVVFPGTYNEANLLKDGVNWYFHIGAIVNYTGASDISIWDNSSTGVSGAITCSILGYGSFVNASTHGTAANCNGLIIDNSSSSITLEASQISKTVSNSNAYALRLKSGSAFIHIKTITGGLWWDSGEAYIETDTIATGTSTYCVYGTNTSYSIGYLWIRAFKINGAIQLNLDYSARSWITADEVTSQVQLYAGKHYFQAKKISYNAANCALICNNGEAWVNIQKISHSGTGDTPVISLGTGSTFVEVQQVEILGAPTSIISVVGNGEHHLRILTAETSGETCGIVMSDGVLHFHGRLDTSSASSYSTIQLSGSPTLVLKAGTVLIPNSGTHSISGAGVSEESTFEFSGVSSSSLSGQYITLEDDGGPVYVWFNVDSSSSDPSPSGRGIQVNISSSDFSSDVASSFSTAINNDSEFDTASISGTLIRVINAIPGPRTNATAGTTSLSAGVAVEGAVDTSTIVNYGYYTKYGKRGDVALLVVTYENISANVI
jgi:hypothetical protein